MTHCIEYWRKWKREGNFCGLRKQDADENEAYLELVEQISGSGAKIESDIIFQKFPVGAARPLLRCKDEKVHEQGLNYVIACLKREETVTGGDLAASINMWLGKPEKKSTQMRTPELVPEATAGPNTTSPLSLADRERQKEMEEAGKNQQSEKDLTIVKECRTAQTDPVFVNPGPTVMVNPVVINDTHREVPRCTQSNGETCNIHGVDCNGLNSECNRFTTEPNPPRLLDGKGRFVMAGRAGAFRTAAQIKAQDLNPLDVSHATVDPVPTAPCEDPKAKRIRLADELMGCLSERFQMSVRDYLQYNHQNGEKTAFDVLYMGAEQMINKPKAPASSSGSMMSTRRGRGGVSEV